MGDETDVLVALVHSHHLLDHKPDNLLLKGAKYKLRGLACLGRPGVALCIGHGVDDFQSALQDAMPQKKFFTIVLDVSEEERAVLNTIKGFESSTLGELRSVLASIGQEAIFFELTGIDPSNSADVAPVGKAGKKKKKK